MIATTTSSTAPATTAPALTKRRNGWPSSPESETRKPLRATFVARLPASCTAGRDARSYRGLELAMTSAALAAGSVTTYLPGATASSWVSRARGRFPVRVWAPKLWPPSATPLLADALGAVSRSSVTVDARSGSRTETTCECRTSSLIRTRRIRPSGARVAHARTSGLPPWVTERSRAPGGTARTNISSP
jgi:hypothetical protein